MRVIFLTTKLDFVGGGGSTIDRHVKALSLMALGCEVKFITVFSAGNRFKEKPPYHVFQENISYRNFFQFHRSVKEILIKYESETDIYYVDGHIFLFGAGQYKKRSGGKPVIGHFDNYPSELFSPENSFVSSLKLFFRRYFQKICLLSTFNLLDLFTFPSPIIKDIYLDFGLKPEKAVVLPAFMDLAILESSGAEQFFCQNKKEARHILYIGRLIRAKGLGVLLAALALLKRDNLVLDVVGSGPDEEYFKKISQQLGLAERVYWHRWVDLETVGSVYRHAQIFVSPALWPEPFGMTTVEAMFCGLPVIVSSNTGPAWIAKDGAGLIFRNGDAADLAEKIKQLCDNPGLGQQLVQKSQARVTDLAVAKLAGTLYENMASLLKANGTAGF